MKDMRVQEDAGLQQMQMRKNRSPRDIVQEKVTKLKKLRKTHGSIAASSKKIPEESKGAEGEPDFFT